MRGRARRVVSLAVVAVCAALLLGGCRHLPPGWPPKPGHPSTPPSATPTASPTASPTAEPTGEPTEQPTEEPTGEPSVTPTAEPTGEPTDPPERVVLTAPFPAAEGLDVAGTSPQPPPGWTGGVVALSTDGRFVVHERPLDDADEDGTLRHWPTRIGIAAPGAAAEWFRPAPTDVAEVRQVTGGDADADAVAWREQPFRGQGGAQVLFGYDRASGDVAELLRLAGAETVSDPVVSGGRAWWRQFADDGSALWSAPIGGGTPRREATDVALVAADRCAPGVLFARITVTEDAETLTVHRIDGDGERTVHTQPLISAGEVTGLAGCGERIAVGTGRSSSIVPPEFTVGRVLVRDDEGATEYVLPPGKVARAAALDGDRLGITLTAQLFDPQEQLLVDLTDGGAVSLGTSSSGDGIALTGAVRFGGGLVSWNEIVNLTYLRATAARLP